MDGVVVHQPPGGFRYGSEAFWLVGFALERGCPKRVADLGTGSGIIAALFASRGCEAVGLDVRPEWQPFWEATLAESRVPGSLALIRADVAVGYEGRFDLVVSNPPYFRAGTGPVASDPFRAAARHETTATLKDFVAAAASMGAGRAVFVLPVERRDELLELGAAAGLPAGRLVHVGRRLVLVELDAEASGVADSDYLSESDSRVRGWYERLGARY